MAATQQAERPDTRPDGTKRKLFDRHPTMDNACRWHDSRVTVRTMDMARAATHAWDHLSARFHADYIATLHEDTPCCGAAGFARFLMAAAYRERFHGEG